jgi:hypothetical protein
MKPYDWMHDWMDPNSPLTTLPGAVGSPNYPTHNTWDPNNYHDYVIKGEMVLASITFTVYDALNLTESEQKARIKEKLARQVAEYILENKLVEFTQMTDSVTGDKTVKARCFLVPSGEVQIIREILKK